MALTFSKTGLKDYIEVKLIDQTLDEPYLLST